MKRNRTDAKNHRAVNNSTESPKNSKSKMVHLKSLPQFLQDNEFLIHNHRPQLDSAMKCFKSVFQMHTETWNIWTHLIGAIGVVLLASYYLFMVSENWHQRLSFAVFFAGAVFCLGASTSYHILICHSEPVCAFLAKLDYCGVVILIVSSFGPWVHFGFYCDSLLKCFYLITAAILGGLCMVVVMADRFKGGKYRALRAVMFIGLGLTGAVPGGHYILTHSWDHAAYYGWLIFMGILYIAGGVIYACRVPERLSPGTFDIWCQSHQILHICVVGGVLSCYHGASKLAHFRLSENIECPSSFSF